jgi:hypothetical protein
MATDAGLELHESVQRPPVSVTLFFVDGLALPVLEDLLAKGQLPHIERIFVRGGMSVRHAVSSLPPVTYANSVSLLTGRFPGHHGVLGNRWFDRHRLLLQDYGQPDTYRDVNDDFRPATVFDVLEDHFTVSVQAHTRRGVSHAFDNLPAAGIDWLFGAFANVDRRVGRCLWRVATLAERVGRWPSVLFAYFPGVDEIGHHHGPDSNEYRQAVRSVDAQIGRIVKGVELLRPAAALYFVLVSDHGMLQIGRNRFLDLDRWLGNRCRLRVHQERVFDRPLVERYERLRRCDAVLVIGGFRRAFIHLKGRQGWHTQPTPRQLDRLMQPDADGPSLIDLPGVELVCRRDGPDRVRIMSRLGSATVERRSRNGRRQYRITDIDENPLGLDVEPAMETMVQGGWHDSRRWLQASAGARYPDFVPQIVEMFDSPRTGDLAVFAAADWTFERSNRGGHGAPLAGDMLIPLFFAGADLPKGGTIEQARLVDVMPTLLDLLGESHRLERVGRIDGVSLLGQLRAAGSPPAPEEVGQPTGAAVQRRLTRQAAPTPPADRPRR